MERRLSVDELQREVEPRDTTAPDVDEERVAPVQSIVALHVVAGPRVDVEPMADAAVLPLHGLSRLSEGNASDRAPPERGSAGRPVWRNEPGRANPVSVTAATPKTIANEGQKDAAHV